MSAQNIYSLFELIGHQLIKVVQFPLVSTTRIYWVYLLSSLVLALFVYRTVGKSAPTENNRLRGFLRFLFPDEVWRHPSAWLDVRYFFLHQMVRLVIYGAFLSAILDLTFQLTVIDSAVTVVDNSFSEFTWRGVALAILYMFVVVALIDLASYWVHYLQHTIPFLWEFHKVHHSAEVMHPLTNYREHPFDNLFYALATGAVTGFLMGMSKNVFGYVPNMPMILGLPILYFMFNILGYNLRHSHIWLRWPGRWSIVFASPAHHQIHHSYHPEHVNKNFAFIFPWWDVLFRTYCVPETNKDVKFGISQDYEQEFKSCLGIYFVPIKNACLLPLNRQYQGEPQITPLPDESEGVAQQIPPPGFPHDSRREPCGVVDAQT